MKFYYTAIILILLTLVGIYGYSVYDNHIADMESNKWREIYRLETEQREAKLKKRITNDILADGYKECAAEVIIKEGMSLTLKEIYVVKNEIGQGVSTYWGERRKKVGNKTFVYDIWPSHYIWIIGYETEFKIDKIEKDILYVFEANSKVAPALVLTCSNEHGQQIKIKIYTDLGDNHYRLPTIDEVENVFNIDFKPEKFETHLL